MVVKRPEETRREQEERTRKRTGRIVLVVMGAAAGVVGLATLDSGPRLVRNGYASREDCEWDYEKGACQDATVGGTRMWYGPSYREDWRKSGEGSPGRYYTWRETEAGRGGGTAGAESALHAPRSVTSVGRGGFGSSGHGFSGS